MTVNYCTLAESLSGLVRNIPCDPAYDDSKLYRFGSKKHLRVITPIRQYPHTLPERINLAGFYNSVIGQELYRDRKISIEPPFEILKSTFRIGVLPVKGFDSVKSFVLICVLVYQLAVYYCNCVIGNENPRVVRRMLCC